MATAHRTFEVEPGSELDRLLDEAGTRQLVLVRGGVRYRVEPEDIWATYDPERAREGMEQAAGAWKDIDTDQLLRDIHAQRGQDSSGRPGDGLPDE